MTKNNKPPKSDKKPLNVTARFVPVEEDAGGSNTYQTRWGVFEQNEQGDLREIASFAINTGSASSASDGTGFTHDEAALCAVFAERVRLKRSDKKPYNEKNVESLSIHERLRFFREHLNMTREQLGLQVNVAWQTVQKWENGPSFPKRSRLKTVAKALGVSVEMLLEGKDNAMIFWPFGTISAQDYAKIPYEKRLEIESYCSKVFNQLALT